MSDNRIVEMMQEIAKKINEGEKEGVVKCPYCGGEVHYVYAGPMAMRAKCYNCTAISVMA